MLFIYVCVLWCTVSTADKRMITHQPTVENRPTVDIPIWSLLIYLFFYAES